jgi:hypothetical protein
MDLTEPLNSPKRSIGKLKKADKTKPRSPDLIGQLRLQRHTLKILSGQFEETGTDEIVCCLAGWKNHDNEGPYLTIEISPKYVRREDHPQQSALSFIFDEEEQA